MNSSDLYQAYEDAVADSKGFYRVMLEERNRADNLERQLEMINTGATGATVITPAPHPLFYIARIERIIDGDTFVLVVDKWHGLEQRFTVRLLEVDTWELTGPEKEQGIKAKVCATTWLYARERMIIEGLRLDSFGRLLCWIYNASNGECLNYRLVEEGHGKRVPLKVHLEQFT